MCWCVAYGGAFVLAHKICIREAKPFETLHNKVRWQILAINILFGPRENPQEILFHPICWVIEWTIICRTKSSFRSPWGFYLLTAQFVFGCKNRRRRPKRDEMWMGGREWGTAHLHQISNVRKRRKWIFRDKSILYLVVGSVSPCSFYSLYISMSVHCTND